jgi:nicotinamide mononucleotide transporter
LKDLLEAIAVVITFLCIVFAAKEKIWTFPLGMIGTALYFFLFFTINLYFSMALQIMFFAFNAYGLYKWTHPGKEDVAKLDSTLAVTIFATKSRVLILIMIVSLSIILGYVMSNLFSEEFKSDLTDVSIPILSSIKDILQKHLFIKIYIDASIFAASLVAQYLMAVKKLENWAIWFVVDLVSAPFYLITMGWATGILYGVFIFTAVAGWLEWKKSYKLTT